MEFCKKFLLRFDGDETILSDKKDFLGVYKMVGNRKETDHPVYVLSNSTFNSLVYKWEDIGWTGVVNMICLLRLLKNV